MQRVRMSVALTTCLVLSDRDSRKEEEIKQESEGKKKKRRKPFFRLPTWNICSGRGTRLVAACHRMKKLSTDISILMETKITGGL